MQTKHTLMASVAWLTLAVGTAAHGQAKPVATAAASNTIEELVVTAEKRSQNLQDVPVAISAFNSERRDLVGINSIADLTNFTPGLEYNSQNDRNTLRGVGRNTNVHAAEGSVAQYTDGIYTSSTVDAARSPLFVDRIEVLRGPQGTLYGRNSIGGAINTISKRPTDVWYAEVRAQLQNYDHTVLEGAVSGPTVIPGVDFRLGANWEKQTQGWYKNTIPGQPDEGNVINEQYYEGQLKFHFNDRFDGWVKVGEMAWQNQSGGPGSRNTFTKTSYPAGTLSPGLPAGGSFPAYEFGNGALYVNPGYACLPTSLTGVTHIVTAGGVTVAQACNNANQSDPRKFTSDSPYSEKLNAFTEVASEWIYHFDHMDLKYVLGGQHYNYQLNSPSPVNQAAITQFQLPFVSGNTVLPGVANIVVNPRLSSRYEENETWISHELNLASSGSGPLQWIAGAYAYDEHYTQPSSQSLIDQGAPLTTGPFLTNTTCVVTGGVCAPLTGNRRIYDDRPKLDVTSRAAFGQIDWAFATNWKTTLGIRYTQDHKSGEESVRVLCFDAAVCAGPPERFTNFLIDLTQVPSVVSYGTAGHLAPGVSSVTTVDPATGFATRHYDNKWSATTGTAGVQWTPDAGTLAYFRYSRGYKAGGFQVGIGTVLGAQPNTNPEHVNAFEIGLKKDFGRTLQTNVAVFHYDYSDAQIPISIVSTTGGLAQAQSIFYNIPKAVTQGFELETIWQPIEHLQLLFNYSYLDAHITRASGVIDPADPAALDPAARPIITQAACLAAVGTAAACSTDVFTTGLPNGGFQRGQNLSGSNLPNAPKNKVAFNVNYTWEMNAGSLTPSVSYIWHDKQYGSIFNRAYYLSPSYSQVDMRLVWKSADKHYSVIGFVKNVGDTIGYEGGAGASRRAGTIPAYVAGTIPAGGSATTAVPVLQGISSGYTITPPRTFGVELQYRFN
jgi:iron complex outermembrane receptor protein